MSDTEHLQEYEKALDHLKSTWNTDMELVRKDSKLKLVGAQFRHSIDYVPQDLQESMSFLQSLVTELQLWGKSTANKSLNQMREEVKLNLEAEQEMDDLIKHISKESMRAKAMKRIMRYVYLA